jgi:hypothetical protein
MKFNKFFGRVILFKFLLLKLNSHRAYYILHEALKTLYQAIWSTLRKSW